MNNKALGIFAVLTVVAAASADTNLIKNGEFKDLPHSLSNSANGGKWSYFTNSIPGWYSVKNDGKIADIEVGTEKVYGVDGAIGNVLELDSNQDSTIAQKVQGLKKKDEYKISFLYSKRAGTSDATNDFDVLWNNKVIGKFDPSSTKMKDVTLDIWATGTTGVLSFEATGKSDSYGGEISDVRMSQVCGTQPVPEPTTLAATAFGLIGFAVRRRSAKK